jgi:DNA polymerase-3 subunit gamma/tau
VALLRESRDVKLLIEVENYFRLAKYSPGRIEFQPTEQAPADLAQRLGQQLQRWTGARWAVIVVKDGGAETIAEERDAEARALRAQAAQHPLVAAVLAQFPGAAISEIKTPQAQAAEAFAEALPEVDDEWDPFEDQ